MPVTVRGARLGISFSGGQAHILAVRPALWGRAQAVHLSVDFDWQRLDDASQRAELITALRRVKTRCPARSYRVLVCLPPQAAWRAEAPAPPAGKTPAAEIAEDAQAALGPWPLEEMIISRKAGSGRPAGGEALVARRQPLEDLAGLLAEAGLTPAVMDASPDLLALSWSRLPGGPRQGLAVYLEDGQAQWALLEKGKALAGGLLTARDGEGPEDLARRCLGLAVRRAEPRKVSEMHLAGPAAGQAAGLAMGLAAESPSDDQPAAVAVHRLERNSLLPPDLDWPYLPLWGTVGPRGRSATAHDLWPGPPAVSRLENPRLTRTFGIAAAVLLILAVVQYVALPYLEHSRAQRLVAELKEERAKLKAQKQELLRRQDALLAVIQVREAKEQALAGLLEVNGLLPPDARLDEFTYSQGGLEFIVQGVSDRQLSQSLGRSRLLALNGDPSRLLGPGRQATWKISMSFQEGTPDQAAGAPPRAAPPARPGPRPTGRMVPPAGGRPAPPPPPNRPPTPNPGGGLPRPR